MKRRPTIRDVAEAAGVSVATVNRVIGGSESVRKTTVDRVRHAAEAVGFYGLGTIEAKAANRLERFRLGVLLQQGGRPFYMALGQALRHAASDFQGAQIDLSLGFLDDLSPDHVAARLTALGKEADAVALVAADHPLVSDAIDSVTASGVPVLAMIAPLSAKGNLGFVGLDNWKVGRTAAWAFHRMCRVPGKIGILVGNHRYRNQELNESGFRSYFREHQADFTLLEPLLTYESAAIGREVTEKLLAAHPDLVGLFISGGGISGVLAALRGRGPQPDFVCIGYELMDITRTALIDGTLSLVISHPLDAFARATIETMVKAKRAGSEAGNQITHLGFEIYTPENV